MPLHSNVRPATVNRRRCVVMALFLAHSVVMAGEPKRITGIYSNLAYNQEGGDLLGMEVFIIPSDERSGNSYTAFVQVAEEGAPFNAMVALKTKGNRIEFTLPRGGTYSNKYFVGAFKGSELVIRWENGDEEHLRRGKSYWQ